MKQNNVKVTCSKCGKSKSFHASSPAAPMLTALEEAHKTEGWAYEVGFFTMMTGNHYPICPRCLGKHKLDKTT